VKKERTFVLLKPDAVKRKVVGEILSRFERVGLEITALKVTVPTESLLKSYLPSSESWIIGMGGKAIAYFKRNELEIKETFNTEEAYEIGKRIEESIYRYMTSGPVIAVVLRGFNAIEVVRKLVGNTIPAKAEPGTIRGDYESSSPDMLDISELGCQNLIHAADCEESARKEIQAWFNSDEVV